MLTLNKQKGFTLVELSIVIVIIGLIVAGVTAGESLVRSAKLARVATKFNVYYTATNTFFCNTTLYLEI